jgi:hypothetical protein
MPRPFCRVFVFALLAVAAAAAPGRTVAATLPAANFLAETGPWLQLPPDNYPSQYSNGAGTQTALSNNPAIPYFASAVASPGTSSIDPYATAKSKGYLAVGYGEADYYFEVVGPQSISVPISIQGELAASQASAGTDFATSSLYLSQGPGLFYKSVSAPSTGGIASTTGVLGDVNVNSNSEIFVQLAAHTGTYTYNIDTALADPYFSIDPSWLAANPGYSLEFSDGIDNVPISATPLPPALPMFGAALFALGACAWRRRRNI